MNKNQFRIDQKVAYIFLNIANNGKRTKCALYTFGFGI